METSSNWIKKGALLATAITAVFFMSGYGVAGVEKIWAEKTTLANKDVSLLVGHFFRGLEQKLRFGGKTKPRVVNVKPTI